MRIGILTLTDNTNGYNYGATFQCLALQRTLERLNNEVLVFNFKSDDNGNFCYKTINYLSAVTNIREFIGVCGDLFGRLKRIRGIQEDGRNLLAPSFDKIINHKLNMTRQVSENNIAEIANELDAVVVGSDQVWWTFAKQRLVYLMDWVPEFTGIRISYAACSARKGVPRINKVKIAECINKMDAVSVRDAQTRKMVKNASGVNAKIVLDPTFLYDFKEEMEAVEITGSYILAYILGSEIKGGFKETLCKIRSKYGSLKLVVVAVPGLGKAIYEHADILLKECSPGQWLTLFSRATFVLTDSFHGVCFCLKYKRNFIAYYRSVWRASRLLDLKNRFGLNRNIVSSLKEAVQNRCFENELDYKDIDIFIEKEREISEEFLRKALTNRMV